MITAPSYSDTVSLNPSWLYSAIKESCSLVSRESLQNSQIDKLRAGYFPGQKMTQLLTYLAHNSFKSALFEINLTKKLDLTEVVLSTPEVQQALTECYPNEIELRQFFLNSISRSDRAGKIVGVTAMLLIYKFGGTVFSKIKNLSSLFYYSLTYGISVSPFLKSDSHNELPELKLDTENLIKEDNIEHLKQNRIKSLRSRYFLSEMQILKIDQQLISEKDLLKVKSLQEKRQLLIKDLKDIFNQIQHLAKDIGVTNELKAYQ